MTRALRCLALLAVLLLPGACVWRDYRDGIFSNRQPFELPNASTRRIDDVTVHTLQNGLTLIHRRNTTNSIVGAVLYIRTGSSNDPPEKAGLTNLMMRLLPKGTTSRSADQVSDQLGLLGASLAPSAGRDFCKVSLQCVNEDFPQAMELMADVVFHPTFPAPEIDLEKKKVLAQIRMGDDLNHVVATKRFMKELFGSHPYGFPLEGEKETVESIQPGDILRLHGETFAPSAMVLCVVGGIDEAAAQAVVEKVFGGTRLEKRPAYAVNKIIAPGGSRTEIARKAEQAFIVLGHLTCPTGDADEPAVEVATNILGTGMSSRLFVELRDKQGLAYSVGASATFLKNQGYFLAHIGTAPKNVEKASEGLWAQIDRLRTEPVGEEELQRAKNYIAGQYLRSHERNMQQASYLGYWFVTGREPDFDARYLDGINAVTSRDVMRVANKYFLEPSVVIVRPTGEPTP